MSTRGAMGVRIGGIDKVAYCHCDCYPEGLGKSIVSDVRKMLRKPGLDGLKQLASALRVVDPEPEHPTPADVEHLQEVTRLDVSNKSALDWYCLTRELQGDFATTLRMGILLDGANFLADSLFCEYAYVVNLDDMSFEAYRGFQEAPHTKGRYADLPRPERASKYWPVALVGTFDLADIPRNWAVQAFPEEAT